MRLRNERWQTGAGLAVERRVVGEHRARVGRVRQHAERLRGRARAGSRRPGPCPATGCSWSSAFIACIADGDPMPAAQPPLEAVARRRLRPHRAVVAAPEEADEAQAGLVELRDDVVDAHARNAKAAWRARCATRRQQPAAHVEVVPAAAGEHGGVRVGQHERVDEDLVGRRDGRDAAGREVPVGFTESCRSCAKLDPAPTVKTPDAPAAPHVVSSPPLAPGTTTRPSVPNVGSAAPAAVKRAARMAFPATVEPSPVTVARPLGLSAIPHGNHCAKLPSGLVNASSTLPPVP